MKKMEADLSRIVNRLINLNISYHKKMKEEDLKYAMEEQIKNVTTNLTNIHTLLTEFVTTVSMTILGDIATCNAVLENGIADGDLANLIIMVSKYPMIMRQVEEQSDDFKIIYDTFFDSICKICSEAADRYTNSTAYWNNLRDSSLSGKLMNDDCYKVTKIARDDMKQQYGRCARLLINLMDLHNQSRLPSSNVDERAVSGVTRGEDQGNEE